MYVFISHTAHDSTFANAVVDRLHLEGYRTYLFEVDSKPGEYFVREMDKALREADAVILIWSHAAAKSNWVQLEWEVAIVRESVESTTLLCPVLLEECSLEGILATRKPIQAHKDQAAALHEICDWVKRRADLHCSMDAHRPWKPEIAGELIGRAQDMEDLYGYLVAGRSKILYLIGEPNSGKPL